MYAIYARQSADKKDSISIETQIEFCKRELNNEEYRIYDKDKGFSGGNVNRPDFQRMMKDIKEGLVTKVIVYRLDRISRSILNFTSMMQVFNEYNVEFVSCTEKLDTTTPAGRMVVNILIVFAQYERESTQQRIKDNYYERAKRGVFLGGNTPYGYGSANTKIANKNTSMLIKNDEQSLIVTELFDMYVNGYSLGEIARQLNSRKVPTKGKGWTSNLITRIIRNPAYVKADINIYRFLELKGCIIVNDEEDFNGKNGLISFGEGDTKFTDISGYNIAVGLHEGFISSETWLKAQYKVYNNKQIANAGTSQNTWLSGISKCGYCGYAMTYKSTTKKIGDNLKKYEHLRCSGRSYKYCDADIKYIPVKDAESDVLETLIQYIKDNNVKISNNKDNEKVNNLKLELMSINKKIDNLVNSLMEADNISMPYINKAIGQLDIKKKELSNQILKYEDITSSNKIIKAKDTIDEWENLDIIEKKNFAKTYINEIKFFKDNRIEISFK